jgi:hypothetical protein
LDKEKKAHSDADRDRVYTVVLFLGVADEVVAESREGLVIANYRILPWKILNLDFGVKTGGRKRTLLEKR